MKPPPDPTRNGTDVARGGAAHALGNLAANDNNREVIVALGAIAPLVELTRSGTAIGKGEAAGALLALSTSAAATVAIVEAGAVAPLLELTRGGTAAAREWAAGLLRDITDQRLECNQVAAVVAAGGIEPLVALVRSGTIDAKAHAAVALGNLAHCNNDNQVAIAAAGAIPLLVELARPMVRGGEYVVPMEAEGMNYALIALCHENAANTAAFETAMGVVPC